MRRLLAGIVLVGVVMTGCTSDNGGPNTPLAEEIWTPGTAPTLVAGSRSLELGVILSRAATISYAIYDRTQSSIDAAEIRDEAAGVGTGPILKAGTFTVSTGQVGDTARVVLGDFPSSTNIFIYLAADPAVADPTPTDLDRVVPLSITTETRQRATTYASVAVATNVGYYTFRPEDHYLHPDQRFPRWSSCMDRVRRATAPLS